MKLYISILTVVLFVSCAKQPPVESAANERIKEKNKQIALKNEAVEITRLAQQIEQQGRDLQAFRDSASEAGIKQCNQIVEERSKGITDLETRIGKLPDDSKTKFSPMIGELNECLSCERKSLNDCKKARATINGLIKELYP